MIRKQNQTDGLLDKHGPYNYRYSTWRLQDFIHQFVGKDRFNIQWIGNDPHAHILAFFYAALLACLNETTPDRDLFIRLKFSLYKESKQSLSISEQKIFVEHLCLLQYSKDIGEFLKKSCHLEAILLKIFAAKEKKTQ